eukprot:gene24901-31295_t
MFQYYREKPLWIPIRWNSLFLVINAVMILLLLKDANDADNIPEEQKFLYTTVFQSKGMKSVDFLHLISSSKRIEHKKGDKLVTESMKNTRVCLVKKGKLTVSRNGEKIGTINQYQFVGAMSFLTWASKMDAEENALEHESEEPQPPATLGSMLGLESLGNNLRSMFPPQGEIAEGTNIPPAEVLEPNVLNRNYYHPSDEQQTDSTSATTESAFTSTTIGSVTSAIVDAFYPSPTAADPTDMESDNLHASHTSSSSSHHHSMLEDHNFSADLIVSGSEYSMSSMLSDDEEVVEEEAPAPHHSVGAHIVPSSDPAAASGGTTTNSSAVEGQSGWADVICEEDCVVFSWNFRDLYELVRENPAMGMVLERCISEDLNRKMANSWQDEPKNRYKQLLTGALMDGEMTPHKKELLARSREELHISPADHLLVLHTLGWSKEEFDAGYKGAPPGDILARYTRLLKRCMESEEGVTEDDRTSLRRFRQTNGVSAQVHSAILRSMDWTSDDYEAGEHIKTPSSSTTASISSKLPSSGPLSVLAAIKPALTTPTTGEVSNTTTTADDKKVEPAVGSWKDRFYYARRAYHWMNGTTIGSSSGSNGSETPTITAATIMEPTAAASTTNSDTGSESDVLDSKTQQSSSPVATTISTTSTAVLGRANTAAAALKHVKQPKNE